MVSYRDEIILQQWEDSRFTPNEPEADCPCCECGNESDFEIDGRCYCESCAADVYKFFDEEETCEYCGEVIEESYFSVNGEVLCPACFEEIFRR